MEKYNNTSFSLPLGEVGGAITPNFSWQEMTASTTAEAHGIPNQPGPQERKALKALVTCLLQPLRGHYGRPIRITSAYRSPALNRLVGGVPSSQHVKGEAADCVVDGDARDLLDVLLHHHPEFDQAILYTKRNFLHLSYKGNGQNRGEIIVNYEL